MLIALEGIDGAGKTTLANHLAGALTTPTHGATLAANTLHGLDPNTPHTSTNYAE